MTTPNRPGIAACLRRVLTPLFAASSLERRAGMAHQLAGIPVLVLTGEPRLTRVQLLHHHNRQIGAARH